MTATPCQGGCERQVHGTDELRLECWSCNDHDIPCQGGCGRPVHVRKDGLGVDGWCLECLSCSGRDLPL